MERTKPRLAACALFLSSLAAAPAFAGETNETEALPAPRFEITPFVGQRFGGDFALDDDSRDIDLDDAGSLAIALDWRIDAASQYELFYGRQSTELDHTAGASTEVGNVDIDVEYLQIGGTLGAEQYSRVQPYMVGTLGATRFSPDFAGARDETRFSLSLGAGLRIPVSRYFSVRLEGRGYVTFVDTDTAFFCASGAAGGVCRIRGSGSTFIQYDLLAGAALAF